MRILWPVSAVTAAAESALVLHITYAGIPCRFKYKEVEPEGFGLTAEEILLADDSELNKFVSLKHISAYNTKGMAISGCDCWKLHSFFFIRVS